jgi:glyoxylase-like metal-dependent hydrolase (beta-lactamase superfamily II)
VLKPVADHWYAIKPLDPQVLWIREIYVDPYVAGDIWLVRGAERDLVVDTGMGIVPPAPVIEALTTNPIVAIALNCYFDHSGGWHSFNERLCHPLDAEVLGDPSEESRSAHAYLTDESLSALPRPGYATSDYRMQGAAATGMVEEGDSIDLGDRVLEVVHLPGRSPGGIALWESGSGSLFTSDMLYDGSSGAAWPPDEPAAYCESLRRLLELPVRRVYPGHYGPFDGARMAVLIETQVANLGARQESVR